MGAAQVVVNEFNGDRREGWTKRVREKLLSEQVTKEVDLVATMVELVPHDTIQCRLFFSRTKLSPDYFLVCLLTPLFY